jgi:hypothetical protein
LNELQTTAFQFITNSCCIPICMNCKTWNWGPLRWPKPNHLPYNVQLLSLVLKNPFVTLHPNGPEEKEYSTSAQRQSFTSQEMWWNLFCKEMKDFLMPTCCSAFSLCFINTLCKTSHHIFPAPILLSCYWVLLNTLMIPDLIDYCLHCRWGIFILQKERKILASMLGM